MIQQVTALIERYTACPHCTAATVRCEDCQEGHLLYGDGSMAPCASCGGRGVVCPNESGMYFGESFNRGCEGWRGQIARELAA